MIIPSQADVLHGARDVQPPHLVQTGPKYYSGVMPPVLLLRACKSAEFGLQLKPSMSKKRKKQSQQSLSLFPQS